ncbi:hypothetical protein E5K00_03170 [Hymenobacter aquaticus]|uniref:PepSY domain-containing protein n=1 Tax=Hymenobacter aquaticus TaxID=1867101 RepID=A0A4Z0Q405_9BACT|nr:hypothetical protein [Hymenobacter aquaticus]TGE24229.1 hypothetical protein E5K00_03170 [Hymenobacter aquaticus]
MDKVLLAVLVLIISMSAFAQDVEITCEGKVIRCENGNKDHFDMVNDCPYEEVDTTKLPQKVLINAKAYLIKRVGVSFYRQKLNYYQSQIVDFARFDEIKKQKGWIDEKSDKRVKYAIQYYFVVEGDMKYYISIVFDEKGNIISKDQLPAKARNNNFDRMISVCDAKKIAESDELFSGKLEGISLEYYLKQNALCWRAEKPSVKGSKSFERMHRFIWIDANTGQIVKRESEAWRSAHY